MSDATLSFPFSEDAFRGSFAEVARLICEEWAAVDRETLDATEGDPQKVLDVVVAATGHSKVWVRKHLAEIAEVAGVDASGIEARLVRLLHFLEDKADPIGQEAQRLAGQVREHGVSVGKTVAGSVEEAEATMKDNLWVSLIAALGLGVLAGLVMGLTRGR
ncbi:MAG: hypothetical protein ACJAZO_000482 [Myxococcota bacterium]|jgi:hypothetical protein